MSTSEQIDQMTRRSRATTNKYPNYNEDYLAGVASDQEETQQASPLGPEGSNSHMRGGETEPQECPSRNSDPHLIALIKNLESKISGLSNTVSGLSSTVSALENKIDNKFDMVYEKFNQQEKRFNKKIEDMERKFENLIEKRITDLKEELRNERNAAITKKVEEEVQKFKSEMKNEFQNMQDKLLEDDKTRKEEYDEMRQKIAEQEDENYSKKIVLCGNAVPRFQENESAQQIAQELIKTHLKIVPNGCIANVVRFGTPDTGNGQRPNDRLLVTVNNIGTKRAIIDATLKMRSRNLFVNELLPKRTNEMFHELRKYKKDGKIAVLYTKDGVIRAKKTREGSLFKIRSKKEMEDFIVKAQLR